MALGKHFEFGLARLVLLAVPPAVELALGGGGMFTTAILTSVLAVVFDLHRQRKRWLPFPIYLLLVYAVQLSWYIIGLHATSASFSWAHTAEDSAEPKGNIRTMTVVLAAHNEHDYIKRTLESIYERTPPEILREVIVVDDGSDPPLTPLFRKDFPEVKVIRHEKREGLIKSKTKGGNKATSDMIMFLDAHVKPEFGWAQPILRHMNINYKRVVVPLIPILDGRSWETNNNAVGVKMMFDWTLFFQWFEDYNDLVPCMSGGLFGITKQWWHESGEYDFDMAMWGAENIEQSIRIWLCGGEIYVARNSRVAHVFRAQFPYKVNNTEIYINKVRTVETWFDEYKESFYAADPAARQIISIMGDISSRQELRKRLQCKPFEWYVNKFRPVFLEKYMLPQEMFVIRDKKNERCVRSSADRQHLEEVDCDFKDPHQQWCNGIYGTGLRNVGTGNCLDANAGIPQKVASEAFLYHCYPNNNLQMWQLKGGQVQWQKMCLRGAREGRLKLTTCGLFLASEGDFEKYPVHGSPHGPNL